MYQKPFIIGLSGLSGSGKTTFLNRLNAQFTTAQLCVISQDNYYKKKDLQQADENGVHNFDRPESIHRTAFFEDLKRIIKGETIEFEEYTFNNALAKPKKITISPAPIIFIEGLFVFHYEEIRKLMDMRLFLNVKETTAFGRRIRRDQIERNYPLDDILYRYENHVLPNYERYIKPHLYDVDMIINNQDDFGYAIDMLSVYFREKILK